MTKHKCFTTHVFVYTLEWLDARTFRKYANTVHQVSDQVKNLERGIDAARHEDISRIENFLQRLEQKVITKFNSTLTQLSSEVVAPVSTVHTSTCTYTHIVMCAVICRYVYRHFQSTACLHTLLYICKCCL